jgi:hypothetical protein
LEDEHIIKGTFGKALRANSQIPIGYLLIRGELIFFSSKRGKVILSLHPYFKSYAGENQRESLSATKSFLAENQLA